MEIENIQKISLKKRKIGICLLDVLVIVWCASSTVAYLYQFNHLFENIWKILLRL